jgi:hypothetical protein
MLILQKKKKKLIMLILLLSFFVFPKQGVTASIIIRGQLCNISFDGKKFKNGNLCS